MGKISAKTLRRIYLLYLIGRYKNGVYGSKRLQKIAFLSEYQQEQRPFEFIKYKYGQYSDELSDVVVQLATIGYVSATDLDTVHVDDLGVESSGSRFALTSRADIELYQRVLAASDANMPGRIDNAIATYGYKPEQELIDYCYSLPEFQKVEFGEVVLTANLADHVEVSLSDDECEDVELSMYPRFIDAMLRLTDTLDEADINWKDVRHTELHASTS